MDIQLNAVCTHFDRQAKGLDGVFQRVGRRAAVSYYVRQLVEATQLDPLVLLLEAFKLSVVVFTGRYGREVL